ncbi:MAG: FliI/YscN family ATPase [Candidatus Hydrogenedentes bacterium]|nr:FliI/YscN family ATPase [Candidatus Hydrogenedentota bacterium]
MAAIDLHRFHERLDAAAPLSAYGKVVDVFGLTIQATGPHMNIGDLCFVVPADNGRTSGGPPRRIPVEVVGFRDGRILLMPLSDTRGIGPSSLLIPTFRPQMVCVGPELLGRVTDSMGAPLDGGPPPRWVAQAPLRTTAPHPLRRRRITEPIVTGIRAIDSCLTCGKGQRVGIMSGSGIGKSKLIGMIARNTNADVNVIALIGERGREVRDFIEGDLGEEGLARSVVVVATSDGPALQRLNGAFAATSIAEWFRDQGADVMLMMDSVTRFAMAQREVGLAVGEPPTTKGYPPSVYAALPKLLERAGMSEQGSITGFYAVLVEADDLNDPVGDAVRSILDGHVALSRDLAARGQYPAVDVLQSVSRTMIDVTGESHQDLAARIRGVLATYRDAEDLVNIGAYASGSNPEIDRALRLMPGVRAFLKQGLYERFDFAGIEAHMRAALGEP